MFKLSLAVYIVCMLTNNFKGLEESDIRRYEFELCKLDLTNLSELEVANKIVKMSKLEFGLKMKRMGKQFLLYSDFVLMFLLQVTVILLLK